MRFTVGYYTLSIVIGLHEILMFFSNFDGVSWLTKYLIVTVNILGFFQLV